MSPATVWISSFRKVDADFRDAVARALAEENGRWPGAKARLSVTIDTIGIRTAGSQPDSARIVRTALAALGALGRTTTPVASTTDANFPMGLGIPSITLDAGGSGEGAHSPGEWYDDGAEGWLGPQWVALVVTMLAERRQGGV